MGAGSVGSAMRFMSPRVVFLSLALLSILSLLLSCHLSSIQGGGGGLGTGWGSRAPPKRGILSRGGQRVEATPLTSPLLTLLKKLEKPYLEGAVKSPYIVLLRGQKLLVTKDLPTYSAALHRLSSSPTATTVSPSSHPLSPLRLLDTTQMRVRMVGVNGSVYYALEDEVARGGTVAARRWRVLLCLTHTDGDSSACLPRKLFSALEPQHKVGRIPGLRSTLWRRDAFCELLHASRLVPSVRRLSPPCYALPAHTHHLSAASHALPDSFMWVIQDTHGGPGVEVVNNRKMMDMLRNKRLGVGQVVQAHWGPPLEVLGTAVCVRVYLLLTSLQPLRAHLHTHAEVTFRAPADRGYTKIPGRTWTWAALASWVEREGGDGAVRALTTHTEELLTTLALVADLLLPAKVSALREAPRRYRCDGCFHLMAVDLVYNSTFHPVITGIDGQPDLSLPSSAHPALTSGREKVVRDLLMLLTGDKEVAGDVLRDLTEVADNVGVVGLDCLISHELCLTPADLEYLLQTRRENKNSGLWELTKHGLENTSTLEQDTKEGREGTKRQLGNKENLNEIVYGARTFSSSKQPSELTDGERKEKQNILVEEEGKGRKVVHTLNKKSDEEEKQENERNSDEVVNVKDDCYNDADCNKAAGVGDSGGFVMIYPSPVGHLYDQAIDDLYQAVSSNISASLAPSSYLLTESWRHLTHDLHGILTSLEEYTRPLPAGVTPLMASTDLRRTDAVLQKWQRHMEAGEGRRCMDDPATAPYLQRITLSPDVPLTPLFTPLVTSYWGQVAYEIITVKIAGIALHCQAEARLDDKFGASTLANYTLGLGENKVVVVVVEIGHSEPWTLNTYTIHLTRLPPPRPPPPPPNTPLQVCALKQECGLKIVPSEPCGLTREAAHDSWPAFLKHRHALQPCNLGDAPGRWVLPCVSCEGRAGCDWERAVWQPYACSYYPLPANILRTCLKGKTLVFIGDSTNRGMLYTLLEWVNGTLNSWDKTHDLKLLKGANHGHTTFAFAYYPRFWLPSNQRPTFDQTFDQLMQRAGPLSNSTKTVVVVGGVHWLAVQHLHMLTAALLREGLEGAVVVVKTPGAGFHVAAPGVHTVSSYHHARLLHHSQYLSSAARSKGYLVVDTLNITAARYRHFLQGKCACHFHQVSSRKRAEGDTQYHVEGEINTLYTNILANTICQHQIHH